MLLGLPPEAAAGREKLHGCIPGVIKRLHLQAAGRLPGTQRLQLAIGLPLRNQDALGKLLQEISDPTSPHYRHYLTPAQFAAQFGPTPQDYQALITFVKANGLTVTGTHPNRAVLDVKGTTAAIEQMFHVTMHVYPHPKEARTFYAPDVAPMVDAPVAILHVSGLDNYELPHPNLKVTPVGPTANVAPLNGSEPGGRYWGNDFRTAYVPGTTLTGVGQNVALVQFDGYYTNDIASYISQAGITTSVTLTNVPVNGGVANPGSNNIEVALDIEMVVAMAPGSTKIFVYEAPNGTAWATILGQIANDNLARQISCSWGGGGPDPTSEQIFQQMAAQGQTFFDASGDADAFTGSIPFPADSTNIVQVGGTDLNTVSGGGPYVSETVWNDGTNTTSGSSGGISTYHAIPPWQQGVSMSANLGSTTMRNVPDVAMTGSNVYVIADNGKPYSVRGTSCAAPLWAGFTALVNQQAAANGQAAVGFLNPAFYAIGKSATYTNCFHDITVGNNFSSTSPTNYPAVVGYDLCTGWGTPTGTNLINALATPFYAPNIVNAGATLLAESCAPTNGVVDPGETVTINFALQNTGTGNTTNLVATLLATGGVTAPSGPQTYGSLVAGGAAVAQPFTFTATGACGGTITNTFQLQDGANVLGTVTFLFTLGQPGTVLAENFDGVSAPNLPAGWTTFAGGAQSPWVTSTSQADTAPNAAFSPDPSTVGSNALVSPLIAITGTATQLTFRQYYNLESSASGTGYDGGVLEISIGGGPFTDILAAGGSFASGGYNRTISTQYNNPLAGRQAWSGNSGGFITTVVNLPAAAVGQNIQLRWVCGTDSSVNGAGWYVDTVAVTGPAVCCTGSSPPPLLAVAPASFNFGTLVTGQTSNTTFNVINTGGGALTGNVATTSPFTIAGGSPYNVNAGQTGTVTVSFAPLSAGNFNANVIFTGNGGVFTGTVTGAAVTPAALGVSPASYPFGVLATGTTAQTTFVVTNSGGAALSGTASAVTPFSIVAGSPFTVNGFSSSNVVVRFSPAAAVSYATNVIFVTTAGNSTNAVTGTGAIIPLASFTASSTTGAAPLLVTFTDTSSGTITNRAWSFGDNTFSNTTLTSVSHAYAAGTYNVQLIVTGPVGVSTNTQNNLVVAQTPPQLLVTPANHDFGVLATGTTAQTSFAVTNAGQSTLTGSASAGGVFAVVAGSPFSVAGLGSTNVVVSFTPPTVTSFTGNVAFASNGGNSTNAVTGNGAVVPSASFSADTTTGPAPLLVTFTDTSSGTITNRFWNFGDSIISNTTATSVQHTYAAAGTNTVRLIVSGPLGVSTNQQPHYIIVTNFIAQADLALGNIAQPSPVPQGQPLTYTLTVTNQGLASASSVTITDALPAGVTFVSAAATQGTCTNLAGVISCNLGALGVASNAVLTVVVTPPVTGVITNLATAFTPSPETTLTNNTAGAITTVNPVADLAITGTGLPNPVLTSASLTYTFTVNNLGPSAATAVTVTDALPASMTFLSATASQGACTNTGNLITCSLGGLASNATATVTIVGAPSAANTITNLLNTATVAANEFDPATSNNTATATVTVYLDSVGDGIPDWWRQQYFGNGATTNSDSCATCDPDGDGQPNAAEYAAETNPTDPASVFHIIAIAQDLAGHTIIQWSSVGGLRYRVQYNDSNLTGGFTDIVRSAVEETDPNAPGTPGTMSFTDDFSLTGGPPANGNRIFRIRLAP